MNKPAGQRQTNNVHIYISIPELLELCRKLTCGELRYIWQERKKIEDNKRLIEECNEKLEQYKDELLELPKEIERINFQLMMTTMEYCYQTMQKNMADIDATSDWVTQIRIELKKRLIRKQEMEKQNQDIYSYMHDIFGADIVNLFDLKYNPDERD